MQLNHFDNIIHVDTKMSRKRGGRGNISLEIFEGRVNQSRDFRWIFWIGNAIFFTICIGKSILFYFLHLQCKFFLLLPLGMQIFFLFLPLGMQFIFILCTGNENLFCFFHWECNFFLFFALGMQTFSIFHTGNANLFFP